ncbi:hypothetical protein [Fimbriiglobus ruber]|uniref:HTH marR-type domain-containing protein n=1 Tax=Fimbriiglobus ruber TaxID=1908690 RepID=A0A225DD81_9BACT|nr:hypothetical protein [Fimbriiglobus ruber]OWK34365.1 hypothetical protein FRUB_10336 [Fimbriiglobus ruber]
MILNNLPRSSIVLTPDDIRVLDTITLYTQNGAMKPGMRAVTLDLISRHMRLSSRLVLATLNKLARLGFAKDASREGELPGTRWARGTWTFAPAEDVPVEGEILG